jgi:CDGSH-type Zn-finger protein
MNPFVAPSGARMDQIIRAVRSCPSGALSYALDGHEAREHVDRGHRREPAIEVTKDGPYCVTGGIPLVDEHDQHVERNHGASHEHYALCRCGNSQNEPFCSGRELETGCETQHMPVPRWSWVRDATRGTPVSALAAEPDEPNQEPARPAGPGQEVNFTGHVTALFRAKAAPRCASPSTSGPTRTSASTRTPSSQGSRLAPCPETAPGRPTRPRSSSGGWPPASGHESRTARRVSRGPRRVRLATWQMLRGPVTGRLEAGSSQVLTGPIGGRPMGLPPLPSPSRPVALPTVPGATETSPRSSNSSTTSTPPICRRSVPPDRSGDREMTLIVGGILCLLGSLPSSSAADSF